MSDNKPRISVPASAKKGEVIEIKTLISHPMETGRRKAEDGSVIPRLILNKFICSFNGKEVFSANMDTSVSADPYIAFPFKVTESGKFEFVWIDDKNAKVTETKAIEAN
ncbi:MAG: thiosulfate oxidation carrier complex protein SoxZ [Magnetospirillum sp. WYHS-4]